METWKLKRTRQCKKCPWRKDVDAKDIPNGYTREKHIALLDTDTSKVDAIEQLNSNTLTSMACHETDAAHCVGWLMNQLGAGNNILLRLKMLSCSNFDQVTLVGDQHRRLIDTIPR